MFSISKVILDIYVWLRIGHQIVTLKGQDWHQNPSQTFNCSHYDSADESNIPLLIVLVPLVDLKPGAFAERLVFVNVLNDIYKENTVHNFQKKIRQTQIIEHFVPPNMRMILAQQVSLNFCVAVIIYQQLE